MRKVNDTTGFIQYALFMVTAESANYRPIKGDDMTTGYIQYSTFIVAAELANYRLTISGYNAGSTMRERYGMGYYNNMKFSTWDRDNDVSSGNCAKDNSHGGFWYMSCAYVNINGDWQVSSGNKAVYWYGFDEE